MSVDITYFVHSITEDNERGLATGWLPGKLSADGIKRAHITHDYLADFDFDAVFCSDLTRAIDSTEIFFGGKFQAFIDWRLRECNYGNLDGRPAIEFKKNREQDYIDTPYEGGESYRDVEKRVRSFIADISELLPNKRVAIVAHQAPQLALDVILRNRTWEEAIAEDWRKTKSYQPGWSYTVS